jgi:hypothetical protein
MQRSDIVVAPREGLLQRFWTAEARLFAFVFVVLPNLPVALLWLFLTPRRALAVPLYLLAGLIAVRAPLPVAIGLLAAVAALDVSLVISSAFDLSPIIIADAIRYAYLLDFGASGLYLGVVVAVAATVAAMAWLLRRHRARLHAASPLLALVLALLWSAVDVAANVDVDKVFGRGVSGLYGFDSALNRSQIAAGGDYRAERNLLVVTVEGMGAFADPMLADQLAEVLASPAVTRRYRVSSGTAPYVGSTTGAASRELCGRWGDYLDYLAEPAADCLPARLRENGYRTYSVHGFYEGFFDRDIWYPRIGIDTPLFAEQLTRDFAGQVPSRCGLTFRGLCDREVAGVVRELLVAEPARRKFVYWLTLNTHMPFNPAEAKPRFGCETDGGVFQDRTVCRLAEMWAEVLERVASIAADPRLGDTDILIVGDHNTPFFTRASRNLFRRGEVAWFALRPLAAAAQTTAQTTN